MTTSSCDKIIYVVVYTDCDGDKKGEENGILDWFVINDNESEGNDDLAGEQDQTVEDEDDEEPPPTFVRRLSCVPEMHRPALHMTSYVALGSVIYSFGGLDRHKGSLQERDVYSSELFRFDTSYANGRQVTLWEKCCPSRTGREGAYPVTIDGKIYFMGGAGEGTGVHNDEDEYKGEDKGTSVHNDEDEDEDEDEDGNEDKDEDEDGFLSSSISPWAEIYDPLSDRWSQFHVLEEIKQGISAHALVELDDHDHCIDGSKINKKKLLVVHVPYKKALYSYDFSNGLWQDFHSDWGYKGWSSAFVDDILYCTDNLHINGYNLANRVWFSDPVRGLGAEGVLPRPDPFGSYPRVLLASVGNGKLCTLWANPPHPPHPLCIHYTKFSVDRVDLGIGDEVKIALVANIECSKVFAIYGGLYLLDCLAVDG